MKAYLNNLLLWLSCGANWALFGGKYNQTTSSRMGMELEKRAWHKFKFALKWPDFAFWVLWPILNMTDKDHCKESWSNDH